MRSNFKLPILVFIISFAFLIFHQPVNVSAQSDYKLLAPLPLGPSGGVVERVDINTYIPSAVKLIIALAGGLAVLRIIFGGIQYMSTDAFDGKNEAKSTINNALQGLLLAIGAFAILNTVNPKLVNFKIEIAKQEFGEAIGGVTIREERRPDIDPSSPSLVGCHDCARFPTAIVTGISTSINYKPVDAGGCVGPGVCVVNKELGHKLLLLTATSSLKSRTFQVIESYPPRLDNNTETCRQRGKPNSGECVYAQITSLSQNQLEAGLGSAQISSFLKDAESVGLWLVYQVATQAQLSTALAGSTSIPGYPLHVILKAGIPYPRFSIYNNRPGQ